MSATHDIALDGGGHDFRVRVYPAREPNGPLLVWLHGGAFMFGTLEMPEADQVGRRLSAAGTTVVSVDYTLAPLDALEVLGPRHDPHGYAFAGGHDLGGLPEVLIVNAELDSLRPSGEAFAAELAAASVDVRVVRERGAMHGFLNEIGHPAAEHTLMLLAAAVATS